eukprot:CAMPEP_0119308466 /NCGR_PEP_ID=MMETSP1333-20130426/10978_1 /TAXON_ID=418940 /ORGANISM="Scyphosphaera apsteinii, Strain RCC1455" /LENGTH=579 /DNA_ID=CAMNT_0007312231 /DNA_START=302 /DNA_END=2042 /DNA_ORIENTATION=+
MSQLSPSPPPSLSSEQLMASLPPSPPHTACSFKDGEPSCNDLPPAVEDDPRLTMRFTAALVAAAWGALSASSFVAGAWLGVAGLAGSARTRAKLMAFGGGALAEACTVELFGHVVHEEDEYPGVAWVIVAAGLLGGVFFKCMHGTLHWLLERQKKPARHPLLDSISNSSSVSDGFAEHAQRMSDVKAAPTDMLAQATPPVDVEACGLSCHAASSGDAFAADIHQSHVTMPDAAASAPTVMAVDVPAGADPGQTVQVTLPDGTKLLMKLPDDALPGDQIEIDMPPENGKSAQEVQALSVIQPVIRRMLAARSTAQSTATLKSDVRMDADGAITPARKPPVLNRRGSSLRRAAGRKNAPESVVEQSCHSETASALVVWFGSLLDAIPESFVIGILCVDGLANPADEAKDDGSMLAFVAACFVANLPEAMSASATLKRSGHSVVRIFIAWFTIVLVTGLGACLGALLFGKLEVNGDDDSDDMGHYGIAAIEGVCGGMMWAMVSNTILPESYELAGGNGMTTTGTFSLMGFIAALAKASPQMFTSGGNVRGFSCCKRMARESESHTIVISTPRKGMVKMSMLQ